MILPAFITALTLIMYLVIASLVGKARKQYNVPAPAITGNADFERRYRTQVNTLEQMAVFLPALWMFVFYWVPPVRLGIQSSASHVAALLGMLWLVGRVLYAYGYFIAPEKRHLGFGISFVATWVLLLWSFAGICYVLLHTY